MQLYVLLEMLIIKIELLKTVYQLYRWYVSYQNRIISNRPKVVKHQTTQHLRRNNKNECAIRLNVAVTKINRVLMVLEKLAGKWWTLIVGMRCVWLWQSSSLNRQWALYLYTAWMLQPIPKWYLSGQGKKAKMEFMEFGSEIAVCGNPEKANSVDHILLNWYIISCVKNTGPN